MSRHSGFTILFRIQRHPMFCHTVSNSRGAMVLNTIEEFGVDGPANKVWNRLGLPPPVVFAPPKVIRVIRSLHAGGENNTYMEIYEGCTISENTKHPKSVGGMEVLSQIAVAYTDVVRKEIPIHETMEERK